MGNLQILHLIFLSIPIFFNYIPYLLKIETNYVIRPVIEK